MSDPVPPDSWKREIVRLHDFFEAWFRGGVPDSERAFDGVAGVLAEGFRIVTPSGRRVEREALLEGLRAAHASRPELEISIRRPRLVAREGTLLVAAYEEWQREAERGNGRISTAVLRTRTGAPEGLEWLHVHETWLEAGEDG